MPAQVIATFNGKKPVPPQPRRQVKEPAEMTNKPHCNGRNRYWTARLPASTGNYLFAAFETRTGSFCQQYKPHEHHGGE
jgi:hypothetical protein